MTHEDDLPAEVRRQDEEDELQIAAELADLRKEEHVPAARRRWSNDTERDKHEDRNAGRYRNPLQHGRMRQVVVACRLSHATSVGAGQRPRHRRTGRSSHELAGLVLGLPGLPLSV
jgi:hypothetical protein